MMDKRMLRILGIFLGIVLFYCSEPVHAQKVVLKNSQNSYSMDYPFFLIDQNAHLKAELVKNNNDFKRSEFPVLSLGATTASVWLKIFLVNQSDSPNWFLQIDSPPVLQSVEVYRKEADHLVRIFSRNMDQVKTGNDIRVNNLLLPLHIPSGTETTYYIRAASDNILRLPLKVLTIQTAAKADYPVSLLNGVTFGMLMAFAVYNLFVYLLTREQPYLYYLGYIFFWSLNLFFYNGFLPDVFPGLIWLNSAGTIISMASILSSLFTNSFLQSRKYSPFFYKIRWLMILLSFIILLTDVFWSGAHAFIMIQYCMYPFFIYWFGAGIVSLRNGYKPALYFILGFGCLMLGNAIYNLKDLNILPDNIFTRSSMHWGTLLEVLVLSFALANRLNFYRREKEQLQRKSIEEKRNFLKELLQRQEHEKKSVAMELHDNIGQQLILIKNKAWRLHQISDIALKEAAMNSVNRVADIMSELRGILHRLRPYQMDLLGLTQSINGLMTEAFPGYRLNEDENEDINALFTADEAIHIFRIIQLLTDDLLTSNADSEIHCTMGHAAGIANFVFGIENLDRPPGSFPGITNRLELLKGGISVYTLRETTFIRLSIPYSTVVGNTTYTVE